MALPKVIFALSARPFGNFDYAAFYVGMSRVRKRDDIRLLLTGRSYAEQMDSIRYLLYLRPKISLRHFQAAFEKGGGTGWKDDECNLYRVYVSMEEEERAAREEPKRNLSKNRRVRFR